MQRQFCVRRYKCCPDLINFQAQTNFILTLTQILLLQLFILNPLAHYWTLALPTELSSEQPVAYPHRTTEKPRLVIIPEPEDKMVQATAGSTGSSSREYGIILEIGPPDAVRPGLPFTLPVVVAVRPMGSPGNGSTQQLVANVSLRTESGTCSSGLGGNLTSSVRSRDGNTVPGYAKFSPITISQSGRYRLRVMLSSASQSGVTTKEFVDSNVIQVHGGAPATQKPSTCHPF